MLQKITDQDLYKAFNHFQETKEIDKFRSKAGALDNGECQIRYKLEDDELSELFILFYEKSTYKCLDYYLRKDYTDLPTYLSVYTKHLVLNVFRMQGKFIQMSIYTIMARGGINKDTEELIHQKLKFKNQGIV